MGATHRKITAGSHGYRLTVLTFDDGNQKNFVKRYASAASDVDAQINRGSTERCEAGKFDNTVVIITAGRGIPLTPGRKSLRLVARSSASTAGDHWPGTPAQRINALTDRRRCSGHVDAAPVTCQHASERIFTGRDIFTGFHVAITG
ncbi:hypothetical protein KCP77_10445 [Salmonella enterica subsp. enterica]|nr:hypothetical protein KCP77_10445 [Salmonella enterica subsp. enterica]